ncbi:MAG: glycosyltransferase family 39 protein [Candidatus Omnitrophica bacterium]|nr:glycosyltransferase family 39 protein [Candidatus Omnitrophota bacterium]MBU1996211.1 glycosyltransferase family 39 protein [Candidatus Omnitrophota bacterium]MBU4333607.1 glycosyltransferase family 39 protein [Candidatus Omnitrophota bacterium]
MKKIIKKAIDVVVAIVFSKGFDISIISLGVLFRVKLYLENHSVWLDEAVTTVSIGSRTFSEILTRFDIFPEFAKPPIGFELIEKLSITLFGNNEYAFRLFPLLSGIGSLLLFYLIVKKLFCKEIQKVSLIFFAVCDPLIQYCGDTKPYSSDVLMALILIYVFINVRKAGLGLKNILLLGLSGGLIIWISSACIFILTALGLTATTMALIDKKWKELISVLPVFVIWLFSFIFLYKISLSDMVHGESLKATWVGAFGPTTIFSFATLSWLREVFFEMFKYPGGMYFAKLPFHIGVLGSLIFFVGCWQLFKKDKESFFIFVGPVLITLFAALIGKYPFRGRVILFLVPSIIVVLSASVNFKIKKASRISSVIALVIAYVLLYQPFMTAIHKLKRGRGGSEHNRQTLAFMQKYYLPGDMIFFNTSGQFSFWYYAKNLGYYSDLSKAYLGEFEGKRMEGVLTGQFAHKTGEFKGVKYAAMKYDYNIFDKEGHFRRLVSAQSEGGVQVIFKHVPIKYEGKSDRVWVFLSRCETELKDIVLGAFDHRGKVIREFKGDGAQIYLYDMSSR